VKLPLVAEKLVVKKLVLVLLVVEELVEMMVFAVRSVAVVVASVDVPSTVRRPEVVAFPCASTKKLRFSVHADPFQ
jgi:hypothetical protein